MKISVIVPTYKPKEYLWECLDSLVAQTLPGREWELLLVLNGCCEPWRTQIEQYIGSKMQGINVVFVQTDSPGVSNARNIALDRARGEYITFIDDDDYVSPQYLEELLKKASKNTISLCYPLSFIDGSNSYTPYYITKQYLENAGNEVYGFMKARKYFNGPVYKLLSRDIIGDRRFNVNFKNGEDSLFMFQISDRFKYVVFTSKSATYYRRIRQGSATTGVRSISQIIWNGMKWNMELSKIFLTSPFSYNLMFYITRILGSVHSTIDSLRQRNRNVGIISDSTISKMGGVERSQFNCSTVAMAA